MGYDIYKNIIYIYNKNRDLLYTILNGTNPGRVMLTSYGEEDNIKFPILTIAPGSECIMSDELTIYFTKDKEERDVVQLILEREATQEVISFYLVYDEKLRKWIDLKNKRPW